MKSPSQVAEHFPLQPDSSPHRRGKGSTHACSLVRLLRTLVVLPCRSCAVLAAATVLAPAPTPRPPQAGRAQRQQKVLRAASIALRQIGDPYRYGADGPGSFDCSGLMQYSFRRAGIKIPRTSSAQARRAHRIPKSKLRRGDLMFFSDGGGVYHAAMFLEAQQGHVRDGALARAAASACASTARGPTVVRGHDALTLELARRARSHDTLGDGRSAVRRPTIRP